eukprot:m.1438324 g.1438324  ORF g.1438324 m.1438324 type:complete len:285 (+) comp25090_c1_seq3:6103-6957(+)
MQPSSPLWESPHIKAFLLLQAHFERLQLPIADYLTDTKSVLDQCVRVLQAMVDLAADEGWLTTALGVMHVVQMLIQARWHTDSTLLTLPHITAPAVDALRARLRIGSLPEFMAVAQTQSTKLTDVLKTFMSVQEARETVAAAQKLPFVSVDAHVPGVAEESCLRTARPLLVTADAEYVLQVKLSKTSAGDRNYRPKMARTGRPVNEGWWLVLGEPTTGELVALKRIGGIKGKSLTTTLAFWSPEQPGPASYSLYLMSDCYMGLDQQYEISFEVGPPDDAASTEA